MCMIDFVEPEIVTFFKIRHRILVDLSMLLRYGGQNHNVEDVHMQISDQISRQVVKAQVDLHESAAEVIAVASRADGVQSKRLKTSKGGHTKNQEQLQSS